jgi:DNA relaxase NicK
MQDEPNKENQYDYHHAVVPDEPVHPLHYPQYRKRQRRDNIVQAAATWHESYRVAKTQFSI